jgi:hypothetical protein
MMKRLAFLAPLLLVGCVYSPGPDAWIPPVNPIPPEQIVAAKRSGVPDGTIWRDIEANGLYRRATSEDLVALKQAGASDSLMAAIATAPVRAPQPARPVYYPPPPHPPESEFWSAVGMTFLTVASFALLYGMTWYWWDEDDHDHHHH